MTTTEKVGPPPGVRAWVKGFWEHSLKTAIPVLLIITIAMFYLEKTRPFEYLKGTLVDALTHSDPTGIPNNLVIVEISSDDYRDMFGGASPLHPDVALQLIDAAKGLKPRVIGVDLDTSGSQWASDAVQQKKEAIVGDGTKVIWAQVPLEAGEGAPEEETSRINLGPVLGGKLCDESQMGLVRFPQSEDGYVRAFRTSYTVDSQLPSCEQSAKTADTKQSSGGAQSAAEKKERTREMPSLFHALAEAYNPAPAELGAAKPLEKFSVSALIHRIAEAGDRAAAKLGIAEPEKAKYLKFAGERYSFYTVDANHLLRKDGEKLQPIQLDPKNVERLNHPIVLVGGSYSEARDQYFTPLGPMPGVELIANAVESELGRSVTEFGFMNALGIDVVAGMLIVLIYYVLREWPLAAFGLSLVAMAGVVASGVHYYYLGAFLNLVPLMAGMMIHQMVEGTQQVVELQHEVAEQKAEIAHLTNELEQARQAGSALPQVGLPPVPVRPEHTAGEPLEAKAEPPRTLEKAAGKSS